MSMRENLLAQIESWGDHIGLELGPEDCKSLLDGFLLHILMEPSDDAIEAGCKEFFCSWQSGLTGNERDIADIKRAFRAAIRSIKEGK